MSDLSEQVERNSNDIRSLDDYMTALAGHTLRLREDLSSTTQVISDVNQIARQNREDISSIAEIVRENAAAIRELRAGQDENRAILNQILRRDQERGE